MRLRSRVKQSATAIKVASSNADTATVEDVDTFDDDVKQKVDSAANGDDDNSAQIEPMDQCNSSTSRKSDADIAIARSSKNMHTIQQLWQVPAVSHFCSLFRETFKLLDFDIEDYEDALMVDSNSAENGGRSTLLVDLLIALLKGSLGKDVTLLNYNQHLFDLLEYRWKGAGLGANPLGLQRDSADFHSLPMYAKAKLLQLMCEWRLEMPDVEILTKDLTADSLRVNPLGEDDQGNTYWYFYGTRLYKEQPATGSLVDQDLLNFDAEKEIRWCVVCKDIVDWKNLADSFEGSRSKVERIFCSILRDEFLPSIENIYEQKEKERQTKMAELLAKRTSDRLEVRRLQRDEEMRQLEEREKAELNRLAQIEMERRRKSEQQSREQRWRIRDLEKKRQMRLKMRAQEERARRLAIRQRRQQQQLHNGVATTAIDENRTNGEHDDDLNEIDIEIELETMYAQLEKIWNMVKTSREAEPFILPVTDDIAPDYSQIIARPMDLSTMETKLLERDYRNKFEFIDDMNLIFLNCLAYNGLENDYTKLAQRVERIFIRAWKRYFPPSEVLENERARQDEIKCVDMLGALDKKIRNLLFNVSNNDVDCMDSDDDKSNTSWQSSRSRPNSQTTPVLNGRTVSMTKGARLPSTTLSTPQLPTSNLFHVGNNSTNRNQPVTTTSSSLYYSPTPNRPLILATRPILTSTRSLVLPPRQPTLIASTRSPLFSNVSQTRPFMSSSPVRASTNYRSIRPATQMYIGSVPVAPIRRFPMSDQGITSTLLPSTSFVQSSNGYSNNQHHQQPTTSRPSPSVVAPPNRQRLVQTIAVHPPASPRSINNTSSSSGAASLRDKDIYLLSGPDVQTSNRLFRFVLKDGRSAPSHLIQAIMPQIRRDILRFPPNQVVTVTIDERSSQQQQQQQRPFVIAAAVNR